MTARTEYPTKVLASHGAPSIDELLHSVRKAMDEIDFKGSVYSWHQTWEKLRLLDQELWQLVEDDRA